ncbi:MAG: potassium channel protein [Planctomycetes bacterium]|nr:potassium channel protein [Planctomycetota bacterium]
MKHRRLLYASYRFALFLLGEFRWALLVFLAVELGGGGLLLGYYHHPEQRIAGYGEAYYFVFMLMLGQNPLKYPDAAWVGALLYLIAIVGLGAIADSVVRLGYLIFTSKQKLPEWRRMKASTMRNHIVLCGVGKVGYRILEELLALREDVVAIEKNPETSLVEEMLDRGVTIIVGDCRLRKTLDEANVQTARAVILATNDDLANIDAALTAREIKGDIRVVLRLFDDTMATKVATAFKMPAISTSSTAASSLIAAATDRHLFQSFQIGGQKLHIAGLTVRPRSRLTGRTVGDIQREFKVNIVMWVTNGRTAQNPEHDIMLGEGDQVVFIADIDCMSRLEGENR